MPLNQQLLQFYVLFVQALVLRVREKLAPQAPFYLFSTAILARLKQLEDEAKSQSYS
jgi:hypothetical protein